VQGWRAGAGPTAFRSPLLLTSLRPLSARPRPLPTRPVPARRV